MGRKLRNLQRLLSRYVQEFNARYERTGHLFQGCFDDRTLETEEDREGACMYVLANPVEAGLADAIGEWPWCGGLALAAFQPGQTRDMA